MYNAAGSCKTSQIRTTRQSPDKKHTDVNLRTMPTESGHGWLTTAFKNPSQTTLGNFRRQPVRFNSRRGSLESRVLQLFVGDECFRRGSAHDRVSNQPRPCDCVFLGHEGGMNERGRRRKSAALLEADDAQKKFRDAREKRALPNLK